MNIKHKLRIVIKQEAGTDVNKLLKEIEDLKRENALLEKKVCRLERECF